MRHHLPIGIPALHLAYRKAIDTIDAAIRPFFRIRLEFEDVCHAPFLKVMRGIARQLERSVGILRRAGDDNAIDELRKKLLNLEFDGTCCKISEIDAEPSAVECLGSDERCAAAAEGIEHQVPFVSGGLENAFIEVDRLLCRVAYALFRCRRNEVDVLPYVVHQHAFPLRFPLDIAAILTLQPDNLTINDTANRIFNILLVGISL